METARSRTTRWPPTHCLRICPKRSAERIRSWPHLPQRSQQSPRKQRQFQENSLVKHFRPCGELEAGVRQPVRPSAVVTREQDFGGKSGGAEVVHRGVRCDGLWRAWTEDRSRCKWTAGIHGIGMGRGTVSWTGGSGASAQLVVSMFRTRGHGKTGWENIDTLGPARC